MKKPKKKTKKKTATTVAVHPPKPCDCQYDKAMVALFDEVAEAGMNKQQEGEEFFHSITHSKMYGEMLSYVDEESVDFVLSDAIRFAFEAGRKTLELEILERSVGLR